MGLLMKDHEVTDAELGVVITRELQVMEGNLRIARRCVFKCSFHIERVSGAIFVFQGLDTKITIHDIILGLEFTDAFAGDGKFCTDMVFAARILKCVDKSVCAGATCDIEAQRADSCRVYIFREIDAHTSTSF